MQIGLVIDPFFARHETGLGHVDCPQRIAVIDDALRAALLADHLVHIPFQRASDEQLAWTHEPAYIDVVRWMCDEGFTFIGSTDTTICPASYDVAASASGGVLAACDAVMAGTVSAVFSRRTPARSSCGDRPGYGILSIQSHRLGG